jgi:hypothetical protein
VHVVLDTNVLRGDPRLDKPSTKALLHFAEREAYAIVIPAIVKDEALNLLREDIENARADVEIVRRRLNRILGSNRFVADVDVSSTATPHTDQISLHIPHRAIDEIVSTYESKLRQTFGQPAIELQGYPATDHRETVSRALRREPPFDSAGKDGYRDTVLWESVLEVARATGERVVLVSADRVFRTDKDELHPTLAAEIGSRVP